jgi:hypothetical protein
MFAFVRPPLFFILSASLLFLPRLARAEEPEETGGITRAEMVKAIERYVTAQDHLDEKLVEDQKMIVSHPKMAGPLVMQRLLSAKNQLELGRAAGLLIEMGYDRGKFRAALRKVMARVPALEGDREKDMLTVIARVLERIGAPEDAEMLLPLLKYPDQFVRISAEKALGKTADAEAIPKIERILERRSEGLSAEQLREDYSFREGFKAIADIKYRAFLKKHGGE